ncbi:MAG: 4-hydroxy-3-methylbut-2-enyl diphosphate reductase [Planctomycetes bacterium]|nr:4-hydroxy-3-methylbut-2-enyl diphosphate reductase [Planctomycetota bacterium]
MQVLLADVAGMCFGVRDALAVLDRVERPDQVTIHGELVHNEAVLTRLRDRGFRMLAENGRRSLPVTETVLITAHGISDKERRRLESAGKALVDTTCPLVARAHQAAQNLQRDGYFVIVVGRPGHVEVQGIVEDLSDFAVVERVEDVRRYPSRRLGIMCQTTTPARLAAAVREAIAKQNPDAEIRFVDTICHPTKDHQKALERLLEQVQAMVVVGGKNSNNTRELVARCQERGVTAFHVQSAADLDPVWFAGMRTVGLTAGTSTLDASIQEVRAALQEIA